MEIKLKNIILENFKGIKSFDLQIAIVTGKQIGRAHV